MENYRPIANQSYDTIGEEIDLEIESNPRVREIRFVKVAGMQLMYDAYALRGIDIPAVDISDFVDAAPIKELADIINGKLRKDSLPKEGSLPKEIRVIRPNHERDSWFIFFKQ